MGFLSKDEALHASLLVELQHRVRNTLATTRMIARRSAETSDSLEDYVAHLDGRLGALARVQNAAIRDPTAGIELGLLVTEEITGMGQGASSHVRVSGPEVQLHPRAAEPFALAIHELMTNAIKFGAFSVPSGLLSISWKIETRNEPMLLIFDWVETDVGLVDTQQPKQGFGTLILQEMLKHNLGSQTDITIRPTGLSCRISVPLTERVVIAPGAVQPTRIR